MGLKDFFSKRKVDNELSNAYYGVVESWMDVEYMVGKGLMHYKDAVGLLNAACQDARKDLDKQKEQNIEMYEKYNKQFTILFKRIEEYIATISTDLQV